MPGGDRTGPAGMGPMTGRAAGRCAGYAVPGYMNPIGGRGYPGRGRGGGGWGRRNRFYATGLTGWQRAGTGWPAYGAPPYAGRLSAAAAPNVASKFGMGMGRGGGRGRGMAGGLMGPRIVSGSDAGASDEPALLKQQAEDMARQMQQIQQKIQELEQKRNNG